MMELTAQACAAFQNHRRDDDVPYAPYDAALVLDGGLRSE